MPPKKNITKPLDINPAFQKALDSIEKTNNNVFITGRAGTGKSTLLTYFREHTKKKVIVLAPTGVAAINVQGQTIHSFFGFKPNITLQTVRKKFKDDEKNMYKKIDVIVIDEISMVRADLLDCVDKFLRLNGHDASKPFGGIQMVFIGDLYQLPPVVTSKEKEIFTTHYKSPYFFSAHLFEESNFDMEFIELEKIYRQRDDEFIRLLNSIRNRSATEGDLALLNQRHDADFQAPLHDFYMYLTSTNALADSINEQQLAKIPEKIWTSTGIIIGDFGKEYLPTAIELQLKKGAQIMMLNNDVLGRWVNGTVGKIIDIEQDEEGGDDIVMVELSNGKIVDVSPYTWDIFRFVLEEGKLVSETVGSFTQYPIRLAFAVTIHKSQGKTFDKVIIDIGKGTFAHGQMYVALSRCTTFEGLILKKEIKLYHIRMDWAVVKFLTKYQYRLAEKKLSLEDKMSMIKKAIKDRKNIAIVYLKGKDEKSRRTIKPLVIEEMDYAGHPFLGVEAYCLLRKQNRVFNVERILEIEVIEK